MSPAGAGLVVEQLVKTYPGGRKTPPVEAVRGLDLSVECGECFGLLGPNGAGKSTLFKAICGLVNHTGEVEVNGVHCHSRTDRMDIAYIPQRSDSDITFPITVGELVLAGRRRFHRWYARPSRHDRTEAQRMLALVETAEKAFTPTSMSPQDAEKLANALDRALDDDD